MDEKHAELLAEVETLVTPEGASIRMETTVGRPNRVIELARLTVYNWRKPTEWKSLVIRGPIHPFNSERSFVRDTRPVFSTTLVSLAEDFNRAATSDESRIFASGNATKLYLTIPA